MYSRTYKTLVAVPPLLWVGLFLLLPYALMFAHSFWFVRDGFLVHHWNLQNYRALFTNPLYFQVFLRTARIAASVTLCSLLLGYPLAYYLSFHAGPRKDLLYQLVIVPLWSAISYAATLGKPFSAATACSTPFSNISTSRTNPSATSSTVPSPSCSCLRTSTRRSFSFPSTPRSSTSLARWLKPRKILAPTAAPHSSASSFRSPFPACSPEPRSPSFSHSAISWPRSSSAAPPPP